MSFCVHAVCAHSHLVAEGLAIARLFNESVQLSLTGPQCSSDMPIIACVCACVPAVCQTARLAFASLARE